MKFIRLNDRCSGEIVDVLPDEVDMRATRVNRTDETGRTEVFGMITLNCTTCGQPEHRNASEATLDLLKGVGVAIDVVTIELEPGTGSMQGLANNFGDGRHQAIV